MASSLKVIFAGTPQFATNALSALISSQHQIVAVLTQADKPAGRGLNISFSPIKNLALKHHLPLFQPNTLKEATIQQSLANLKADVMVVAAYGLLLPTAILNMPRLGCINIHPSLLPRWRGAAPIQRTIFNGDKTSGISIMQMDAGLDTGPVLLQRHYTLSADETSETLHDKMAALGADCLLEVLNKLSMKTLIAIPQDNQNATYATKITKEEALINWSASALDLEYKIRAFNPKPVAYTIWQGERLRIWFAKAIKEEIFSEIKPGTIVKANPQGIDVATQNGILRLLQVQLPGGNKLPIQNFYHAQQNKIKVGESFS